MIPSVMVPVTHKEILEALRIKANNRNKIQEFEQKFSEYIGCEHAIATSSGITALYILLKAYGLERGDEVIVPAYTCESVPRVIIDMGLKINFVDIDKGTYNISIEDLHSKMSRNTKAIIAIHMFGNPCEMDEIMDIASNYNSVVIEDSAQCIGAEYKGKKTGTIGDAGFFSLNEGKPITTMGGGFIVTNDRQIAEKSRKIIENFKAFDMLKKIGVVTKLFAYYMLKNPFYYGLVYSMIESRRNNRRNRLKVANNLKFFKYTDMQASIGLIQLSNLENFNIARMKNAKFLIDHLSIEGIHLPKIVKHSKPIFLRFPIWFENIIEEQRDSLIRELRISGIDVSVAYPNSLPKFFLDLNGFPNTEEIIKKTITLPTHPYIRKIDLNKITESLKKAISNFS